MPRRRFTDSLVGRMARAITEAATFALALLQDHATTLAAERFVKCVSAVAEFAGELRLLLARYGAYDTGTDYAFALPVRILTRLPSLPMPGHGAHLEVVA